MAAPNFPLSVVRSFIPVVFSSIHWSFIFVPARLAFSGLATFGWDGGRGSLMKFFLSKFPPLWDPRSSSAFDPHVHGQDTPIPFSVSVKQFFDSDASVAFFPLSQVGPGDRSPPPCLSDSVCSVWPVWGSPKRFPTRWTLWNRPVSFSPLSPQVSDCPP